jgi:hypothetical protein
MRNALACGLVGLTMTGFVWATLASGTSASCSTESVVKAVAAMARHRIELISDDLERSLLDRPGQLVIDTIRAGRAVWKLNYIRDRGTAAEDGVPRCAAVLTVKGAGNARARFSVDYAVEKPRGSGTLIAVSTEFIRS